MINANYHGFEYFPEESSWQPRVSGGGIIGSDITDSPVVDTKLWDRLSKRSVDWTTDLTYRSDAQHALAPARRVDDAMAEARYEFDVALMEMREPKDTTEEEIAIWERLRAAQDAAVGKSDFEPRRVMATLAEEHRSMKDRRALKRALDLKYKTIDRE